MLPPVGAPTRLSECDGDNLASPGGRETKPSDHSPSEREHRASVIHSSGIARLKPIQQIDHDEIATQLLEGQFAS